MFETLYGWVPLVQVSISECGVSGTSFATDSTLLFLYKLLSHLSPRVNVTGPVIAGPNSWEDSEVFLFNYNSIAHLQVNLLR
jgi:hypothetical protein